MNSLSARSDCRDPFLFKEGKGSTISRIGKRVGKEGEGGIAGKKMWME